MLHLDFHFQFLLYFILNRLILQDEYYDMSHIRNNKINLLINLLMLKIDFIHLHIINIFMVGKHYIFVIMSIQIHHDTFLYIKQILEQQMHQDIMKKLESMVYLAYKMVCVTYRSFNHLIFQQLYQKNLLNMVCFLLFLIIILFKQINL